MHILLCARLHMGTKLACSQVPLVELFFLILHLRVSGTEWVYCETELPCQIAGPEPHH